MQTYTGYAMSKKFATTIIVDGFIATSLRARFDGLRYVAVVGPRDGFKGWVLDFYSSAKR